MEAPFFNFYLCIKKSDNFPIFLKFCIFFENFKKIYINSKTVICGEKICRYGKNKNVRKNKMNLGERIQFIHSFKISNYY